MIPKVIHYCWFGYDQIPEKYIQYMKSWEKYCPDYEIKKWDISNFDCFANQYCKEAYEAKQWAFVSDYARLYIIYHYGGIYLDTDVELLQSLTPLIEDGDGFIGFQNPMEVNTGLGFAAAPSNDCIKKMLDIYETRSFHLSDGSLNRIPCPAANTVGLMDKGLKIGKKYSKNIQQLEGIRVYPEEFFNPLNADTQKLSITNNTYTIHQYTASWLENGSKVKQKIKKIIPDYFLNRRVMRISERDIAKVKEEIRIGRS